MTIRTLLFAAIMLHALHVHAQTPYCTNLINALYLDAQIIKPNTTNNPVVNYAKPGIVINDVSYARDSLSNRACSAGDGCTNGSTGLFYEVYYPDIVYSDSSKLPALVMFHAGGFSDCSNTQNGAQDICIEFAKRGYVAFNIEYRRGRSEDPQDRFVSASHWLALYRAIQDGKGAIRTIVSRELAKTPAYRIDVNNIFLAGTSSGTDIALQIAYCTNDMFNQVFTGVPTVLGSTSADNYAGNAGYNIKGILDMWGGFPVPLAYISRPAEFFRLNPKLPPIIAFHGAQDKEVNIYTKDRYFSEGSIYKSEVLCTNGKTFSMPGNGRNVVDFRLYGSQGLYDIFKNQLGMKAELYIDCDMEHGLQQGRSDFGLGASIKNKDVQKYIVQRAATFFQYIMNPAFADTLTHTRFVDCVNTRFGCNGDTATVCSNGAGCAALLNAGDAAKNVKAENSNKLFKLLQSNRNITVHLLTACTAFIKLINLNGGVVQSQKADGGNALLNCSSAPAGVYIVQVVQGGTVYNEKIMLY